MFQTVQSNAKTDERMLELAIGWLVISLFAAVFSGIMKTDMGLVHAYAFIGGFSTTAIMGLIYRLFPAMKSSRLARPQLWIWSIGIFMVIAGRLLRDMELTDAPYQFGSVVAACGAIVFALIFFREREVQPKL